jgi:hypothetical protein
MAYERVCSSHTLSLASIGNPTIRTTCIYVTGCQSGFAKLSPVLLSGQSVMVIFVWDDFSLLIISYRWTRWTRRFTWFRPSERNTLHSQENDVILLKPHLTRVSLSLFFTPRKWHLPESFIAQRRIVTMSLKAWQVTSGQIKPYALGYHRSGVATNVFNCVGTPGLVACLTALGQHCGTMLLRHWSL